MSVRRRYHFLVYEPGSTTPDWLAANPMHWYPSLDAVRKAAREFACEHDQGIRIEILDDNQVIEHVRPCSD